MLLDIAFVDFGGRGEAGAQGVTRKQGEAFFLRRLAADARGQHASFDQPCDVFVRQPGGQGAFVVAGHPSEQGAEVDLCEVQPLLQRMEGAGLV